MNQTQQSFGAVKGTTASGFESLGHLFEQQMRTLAEENAQLCVYHRGKKVVDLWASKNADPDFNADSLVNIFSSGKSLEAIAIASLVSKGLLRYDARVSDHWPEFKGGGKDQVTVADVMRHEAGLAGFDRSVDLDDLLPDNIKANSLGGTIEKQVQRFRSPATGKREYHAVTRGWIANELFRRVDPQGRTIGEFVKEEISAPLNADVAVGLNDRQLERVADIKLLSFGAHLRASLRPRIFGRKVFHNFVQLMARLLKVLPSLRKGNASEAPPPIRGMTGISFFNDIRMRRGETPSANAHSSARGLARVAAMMAAGGKLDTVECLNEDGWQALHQAPLPAKMGGVILTRFTQGGVDQFLPITKDSTLLEKAFNDGREGFYGWMGLGGSIFQWHPEAEIGFAFVPTSLHMLDFLNERGKLYQAEVLKCVANIEANQ
ncbi:serine hydrolase domain-containing protein [Congregibacter litoralis]|uniref:Beta-lactamase class C and other penicillin binding protein n=1 Tax=Congregibacter litoralis KT71 TaxID=314285 RepID=A4A702_9GAMM|nr:serine hydrolase domain-containing protein [Congregibacter litoralis]EAQ98071.1 Beta-lactamase class C and other penicillin binding protein [Congregibacter litoralis KT71]